MGAWPCCCSTVDPVYSLSPVISGFRGIAGGGVIWLLGSGIRVIGGGGRGRTGLTGIVGGASYRLLSVDVKPWKGLSIKVLRRVKPGGPGCGILELFEDTSGYRCWNSSSDGVGSEFLG